MSPCRARARGLGLAAAIVVAVVSVAPTPGQGAAGDARRAPATVTASFVGTNAGAVPDAAPGACGSATPGTRDLTFAASGLPGRVSFVSVEVTMSHGWSGDVALTLIAPNGVAAPVMVRAGAATSADCGNGKDYEGTYTFSDGASTNLWATALAADGALAIAPGHYRASGPFSGAPVSLSAPFAGVPDANGTWTLRVQDVNKAVTGTVSGARLTLTTTDPVPCQQATARLAAAQASVSTLSAAVKRTTTKLRKLKQNDAAPAKVKKAKAKVRKAKAALAAGQTELAVAEAVRAAVC